MGGGTPQRPLVTWISQRFSFTSHLAAHLFVTPQDAEDDGTVARPDFLGWRDRPSTRLSWCSPLASRPARHAAAAFSFLEPPEPAVDPSTVRDLMREPRTPTPEPRVSVIRVLFYGGARLRRGEHMEQDPRLVLPLRGRRASAEYLGLERGHVGLQVFATVSKGTSWKMNRHRRRVSLCTRWRFNGLSGWPPLPSTGYFAAR